MQIMGKKVCSGALSLQAIPRAPGHQLGTCAMASLAKKLPYNWNPDGPSVAPHVHAKPAPSLASEPSAVLCDLTELMLRCRPNLRVISGHAQPPQPDRLSAAPRIHAELAPPLAGRPFVVPWCADLPVCGLDFLR